MKKAIWFCWFVGLVGFVGIFLTSLWQIPLVLGLLNATAALIASLKLRADQEQKRKINTAQGTLPKSVPSLEVIPAPMASSVDKVFHPIPGTGALPSDDLVLTEEEKAHIHYRRKINKKIDDVREKRDFLPNKSTSMGKRLNELAQMDEPSPTKALEKFRLRLNTDVDEINKEE